MSLSRKWKTTWMSFKGVALHGRLFRMSYGKHSSDVGDGAEVVFEAVLLIA